MVQNSEWDAPRNNDHLAVCAASYLIGNALVVGGGRFVCPRAALLSDVVRTIDVIELHRWMAEQHMVRDNRVTTYIRSADGFQPPKVYESIYFDPYPRSEAAVAAAQQAPRWLCEAGRLIFVDSVWSLDDFPGEWGIYDRVRPGQRKGEAARDEHLIVAMRKHLCPE